MYMTLLLVAINFEWSSLPTVLITVAAVITAGSIIFKWIRNISSNAIETSQAVAWLTDRFSPNGGSSLADKIDQIPEVVDRVDKLEIAMAEIKSQQKVNVQTLKEINKQVES